MVYMIGDGHFNASYDENRTGNVIRAGIARGLDFIILAYPGNSEFFERFLEKPGLNQDYEVTPIGSIARITHKGHSIYAVKGEQITSDIEIIAWPIKTCILPGSKKLQDILEEAKEQGAIRVWSRPSRKNLMNIRANHTSLIYDTDAIELNSAPEMISDNEFAKSLSRTFSKPLIGGSDAKMPYAVLPCAGIYTDPEEYMKIQTEEQFMAIVRKQVFADPMQRNIITMDAHHSLASFALQYIYNAAESLKQNAKDAVKNIIKIHL